MRFRPGLVPTLFTIFGLFLLLQLGLWQLRRHVAQGERMVRIEERLGGAPIRTLAGETSAEALDWRLAELEGAFEPEPVFLVTGRFEFGRPGYDVVQPFAVEGGPHLLVVRGWIPWEDHEQTLASMAPEPGTTTVRGLLQAIDPDYAAPPIPASDTAPERWQKHSYASMAEQVPYPLAPVVLIAGEEIARGAAKAPEPLPVTGFVARPKVIGHLEYALTWFLIAATLVGVWIAMGVRRARTS